MIVSIEHSGYHSPIDDFVDSLADSKLTFYASDMLSRRGCENMEELRQALKGATKICTSMHLPLQENFKVVFRSRGGEVVQDWRLSPLA